jgi:hypothetical protein
MKLGCVFSLVGLKEFLMSIMRRPKVSHILFAIVLMFFCCVVRTDCTCAMHRIGQYESNYRWHFRPFASGHTHV